MTPSSVSSPGLKCQAARPRAGVKPNRARVVSRVTSHTDFRWQIRCRTARSAPRMMWGFFEERAASR